MADDYDTVDEDDEDDDGDDDDDDASQFSDLPTSMSSPARFWRLMAMRMPRTVMPSQKHTTTRALGRRLRSLVRSRSKLGSPALLQILSECAMQIPSFRAISLNAAIPLSP